MKWLLITGLMTLCYNIIRVVEDIKDIYGFKAMLNLYNEEFPEHKIEVPEKFKDLTELYEKVYINQVELSLLATATKKKGKQQ